MSGVGVIGLFVVAAAVGGVSRHGLARRFNKDFLVGTLLANTFASGLLGFLVGWGEVSNLVIGVSFAGSLSTWSTLANEIATLISTKRTRLACVYLCITLVTGIAAALVGLQLTSYV